MIPYVPQKVFSSHFCTSLVRHIRIFWDKFSCFHGYFSCLEIMCCSGMETQIKCSTPARSQHLSSKLTFERWPMGKPLNLIPRPMSEVSSFSSDVNEAWTNANASHGVQGEGYGGGPMWVRGGFHCDPHMCERSQQADKVSGSFLVPCVCTCSDLTSISADGFRSSHPFAAARDAKQLLFFRHLTLNG